MNLMKRLDGNMSRVLLLAAIPAWVIMNKILWQYIYVHEYLAGRLLISS